MASPFRTRTCKRRDCPAYARIWMADQGVRLLENILSAEGEVVMLTITAPGADRLPWDTEHCGHPADGSACSGKRGCRIRPSLRRAFNEESLRSWSKLWASVRASAWREFGPGAARLLAYAPEPQARGAIHFHLIFAYSTARELAAVQHVAAALKTRAPAYGWGFVDDGRGFMHGRKLEAGRAAAYVAKYLMHDGKAEGVRRLLLAGELPRRAVYVSAALTKGTRCTMRNLRARRYVYRATEFRMSCRDAEAWVKRDNSRTFARQTEGMIRRAQARGDDPEHVYGLAVPAWHALAS